jgi:hypothetical protein
MSKRKIPTTPQKLPPADLAVLGGMAPEPSEEAQVILWLLIWGFGAWGLVNETLWLWPMLGQASIPVLIASLVIVMSVAVFVDDNFG